MADSPFISSLSNFSTDPNKLTEAWFPDQDGNRVIFKTTHNVNAYTMNHSNMPPSKTTSSIFSMLFAGADPMYTIDESKITSTVISKSIEYLTDRLTELSPISHKLFYNKDKSQNPNTNGIMHHFSNDNSHITPIIMTLQGMRWSRTGPSTIKYPVVITGMAHGYRITDMTVIMREKDLNKYNNIKNQSYYDFMKSVTTNNTQPWAIIQCPIGNPLTGFYPSGNSQTPKESDPLYGREIYVPFDWLIKSWIGDLLTIIPTNGSIFLNETKEFIYKHYTVDDYHKKQTEVLIKALMEHVKGKPYDKGIAIGKPWKEYYCHPHTKNNRTNSPFNQTDNTTVPKKFDCSGGPGWIMFNIMGYNKNVPGTGAANWSTDTMCITTYGSNMNLNLPLTSIGRSAIVRGDFIFMREVNTTGSDTRSDERKDKAQYMHVMIYLGDDKLLTSWYKGDTEPGNIIVNIDLAINTYKGGRSADCDPEYYRIDWKKMDDYFK